VNLKHALSRNNIDMCSSLKELTLFNTNKLARFVNTCSFFSEDAKALAFSKIITAICPNI
jgi:hypothetical protein